MDGLPGQLADVRYHTVAVGKAHFPGKLGNDSIDVADHGFIFRRDLSGGGKNAASGRRGNVWGQGG